MNSGLEFAYAVPTRQSAFIITTANDVPDRDPTAYRIEGFSTGSWQTLHVGGLVLPTARFTDSAPVTLPELPLFTRYRIIFTAVRVQDWFVQIADLKLFGSQSTQPGPVPPAPLPVVSLAVSPAAVAEDGATNLTYTFTRTDSTGLPLTVTYGIAGTATQGTDYTVAGGATGTITFAAGAATATLTVDPTADTDIESDETVALTLAAGTGYTIGTPGAVVGTITNDDAPSTPTTPAPTNPAPLPGATTVWVFDFNADGSAPVDVTALPGYGVATSALFNFGGGGWAGWSVPAGKIVLGAKIISSGDTVADFSVFKAAGPNEVYPHWTYGPAEYGWVLQAKQINHGVQIEVYYANGVDIDVDSNNDGEIDPDNGPAGTDDRIEDRYDLPGVIVPVGGSRVKMIADVPKGMAATLAFAQGTDSVRVYGQATAGNPVLEEGKESTRIVGSGSPQAFWIEAFAPSASIPSIAFSLTLDVGTGSGSTSKPPRDLIRAQAVALDLDVDSNNDGTIDPDNGPAGKDDRIEEQSPGRIVFANTDDDDSNGVADALDAGPVAGENDLAQILLAVAPTTALGSIIVTYDDSIVRLYKYPDRRGPIASGVVTATGGRFYAEGRSAGTTLVTAAFPNAGPVTDTVRLTVQPYPGTIDVDIDSDNNNDFLRPARSEWEDILEDHEYGIGKLIMLDNPRRPLTPIVIELATGLPKNAPSVGVRINWNVLEWDALGVARQKVRLWNRVLADGVRNPAPVSEGGDQILPSIFCKLSDLNYNPQTGTITIWAEGVREYEQLKTLAGVEAAPRVDERIRGTVVVNGDDAAFDEVKYIVANEDSFYHALHTRQEVRNALASRGVYSFVDLPKFSLERKSFLDLQRLGVPDDARNLLGEGSGVGGFKAMVYQDYITGDRQYVLAFGGTDDEGFLSGIIGGEDWWNNIVQGFGRGAPAQYVAAMLIGDRLATQSDIPTGHLIVTGHSLGGGLASAAAMVGGTRADTFNAAWLRAETLLEPDGMGGFRERYPGSLARFAGAAGTIDAYYIDWDILTFAQRRASNVMSIHPVGTLLERDGPYDEKLVVLNLYYMIELHYMPSILYGLLVTESSLGGFTIDMLGYGTYFGN